MSLIIRNIIRFAFPVLLCISICIIDSSMFYASGRPKVRENPTKVAGRIYDLKLSHSPLTFEKFKDVYKTKDASTKIVIDFESNRNFNEDGVPEDRDGLLIQSVSAGKDKYADDPLFYKGSLGTINASMESRKEVFLYKDFTSKEIEKIFNYICEKENREFFFDGSEYNGQETVIDGRWTICEGNFLFTLSIENPDDRRSIWALHKCVDEYPEPGHPLYGLFQLIECEFIPKIKNQVPDQDS